MTNRRRAGQILATGLAAILLLSGCTGRGVAEGTEVIVAVSAQFSSYNGNTSFGSTPANTSVITATNSRFFAYDERSELVADESFGTVTVDSETPLTVTYTIADGVTWSDGVPVDAADLLLAWGANSGVLNSPGFDDGPFLDADTQQYTDDFPGDVVFFDGSSGDGLELVTSTPEIGDGGRSITLVYDEYFVDWRLVFEVGVAAHAVAGEALGIDDPAAAKLAVLDAVQDADAPDLAPLSRFWNSGFNVTAEAPDPALLVGTGPYTVAASDAERTILEANPRYRGDNAPTYERVVLRQFGDPLEAVAALADGTVDVVAPQPTADVARALNAIAGVTVESGVDATHERLDLQVANGRNETFDDPLVREAFLKVIPRQRIVDKLVTPVHADARVRSSHVFLPGTNDHAEAAQANGSADFSRPDPAGAKRLLRQAGAVAPEVCILFDPANPRRLSEFELIQSTAAKAGFQVTDCSSPTWQELLGVPGQYDASLYALRASNLAVTAARASFASSGGVNNTSFFYNAEVDAALDALDREPDAAEQARILTEIDRLVWADSAGMPLYQFPSITAFRTGVTGVSPSPLAAGVLWNVWEWKPAD
jgi:peptide/nickel transport system substrate-binding protein